MTTPIITSRRESLQAIAKMVENVPDKHLLMQRIRLSRLKLGSVLERLESFEPGTGALEELQDHSENVAFEIETLIQTVRELMGR